jgi:hypothetical protein
MLALKDTERLTIHLLISSRREKYEQLTEYYPLQGKATRGRVFTFSHGIVGQVFKTREPLCWSVLEEIDEGDLAREPEKSWRRAMKVRWGFDDPELARVTPGRNSFLAYPVGQEGPHSQAVLFIDSSDPKCFHKDSCDTLQDLLRTISLPQLREALKGV